MGNASKMLLRAFWPPNQSTSLVAACDAFHNGVVAFPVHRDLAARQRGSA